MNAREITDGVDLFKSNASLRSNKREWQLVTIITAVTLLCLAWTLSDNWLFTTDDAYITLRYAAQWADGYGINWNQNDPSPVEGYSNFSYLVLSKAAITAGLDPILVIKLVGVTALFFCLYLLFALSRFVAGPLISVLPTALFATYPGTVYWAVSGLETLFYCLLILLSLYLFFYGLGFRSQPQQSGATSPAIISVQGELEHYAPWALGLCGFCVFLASITRPDGGLVGIVLGAGLLIHCAQCYGRSPKHFKRASLKSALTKIAILAIPFFIPFTLYFTWHYQYFDQVLPNTVLCKRGYDGSPVYVTAKFLYTGFIYISCCGLLLKSLRSVLIFVPMAFIVLNCIIYFGTDPIISQLNRHFLASLALLFLLTAWAIAEYSRTHSNRAHLLLAVLFAIGLYKSIDVIATQKHRQHATAYAQRQSIRSELGKWLALNSVPGEAYMIGDAGAVPYNSLNQTVFDCYCLNSADMTSPSIDRDPKLFVDFVMRRAPRYVVVQSESSTELSFQFGAPIYHALLAHPTFKQRYYLVKKFIAAPKFNYWIYEYSRDAQKWTP